MLIARSPLRITFGGGGTDLPSYYREHGGFVIAGAITKYVYISANRTYIPDLILKYSRTERVADSSEVKHPIIREALALMEMDGKYLEITSMADVAAGTGLGSSSSFTTALLKILYSLKQEIAHPEMIASQACHIEIDRLQEPIGKQDQYIAAFGGLTCFEFLPDDKVKATPLALSRQTRDELEDNLVLLFTGYSRLASDILREQDQRSRNNDPEITNHLHFMKELGLRSRKILEGGALEEFAELMNEHWSHKKQRSKSISNTVIDEIYNYALANGALGGRLIGAGGGGFLLFYAGDKVKLLRAMRQKGLTEVRFGFDYEGTTMLIRD